MRKSISMRVPLLIALCQLLLASQAYAKAPQWYQDRSIKKTSPSDIIGYGEGTNIDKAKSTARREIAKEIEVFVLNDTRCNQKNDSKGYQGHCQNLSQETTKQRLEGLKPLKEKCVGRKLCYVAMRYDNAPTSDKVIRRLKEIKTEDGTLNCGPLSLITKFDAKLSKNGICPPSNGIPQGYPWELTWQKEEETDTGHWYLKVPSIKIRLKPGEFLQFWPDDNNLQSASHGNYIQIKLPQSRLHGTPFFITTNLNNDSPGFLSYFTVSESGQVQMVEQHNPVTSGQKQIQWPDPNLYDGLVSEVDEGQQSTRELYLGVFCEQKIALDKFYTMGNRLPDSKDKNLYLYGELLDSVNPCAVSAREGLTTRK